jgi:hypothetical protein
MWIEVGQGWMNQFLHITDFLNISPLQLQFTQCSVLTDGAATPNNHFPKHRHVVSHPHSVNVSAMWMTSAVRSVTCEDVRLCIVTTKFERSLCR